MATRWRIRRDVKDDAGHLPWCAGGHLCALGEHRSWPHAVDVPGVGRMVVTRVRTAGGAEHAEVRGSVRLPAGEPAARGRLGRLLADLAAALTVQPAAGHQRRALPKR